jgi:hypothetical protein
VNMIILAPRIWSLQKGLEIKIGIFLKIARMTTIVFRLFIDVIPVNKTAGVVS